MIAVSDSTSGNPALSRVDSCRTVIATSCSFTRRKNAGHHTRLVTLSLGLFAQLYGKDAIAPQLETCCP